MASPAPTDAPSDAPKYIIEGFEKQDPDTLRELAEYANELADKKISELRAKIEENSVAMEDGVPEVADEEDWSPEDWQEATADNSAPPKATVTVKNIDGNDYFYHQWREGNSVKSEYIAPVNPSR
jgi:hypothetical protein